MLTKYEARKLRILIRDFVWAASQQEVAGLLPEQGDIDWIAVETKARKNLMAYIKELSTEEVVNVSKFLDDIKD